MNFKIPGIWAISNLIHFAIIQSIVFIIALGHLVMDGNISIADKQNFYLNEYIKKYGIEELI